MKKSNFAPSLLLLALSTLSLNAKAELARPQLETLSQSEASWSGANATVQGFSGDFPVDITNTGAVRLVNFPRVIQTTAEIDMPKIKRFDAARMQDECAMGAETAQRLKDFNNTYKLTMHVAPFSASSQIAIGGKTVSSIENLPTVPRYRAKLDLATNSMSAGVREVVPRDFELMVEKQISAQKQEIASSGMVTLDLTGWDVVACDLASGSAKLSFAMTSDWEASRVYRKPVINAANLQSLSQGTQKSFKAKDNAFSNNVLAAVALGASFVTSIKKMPTDFEINDLLSIFASLVEVKSGLPYSPSSLNFVPLSQGLDHLSRDVSTTTSTLMSTVSVTTRK